MTEFVVYAKGAGFASAVYGKAIVPIAVAAGFGARGMRLNVVFAPVDFADHAADVLRIAAASDIVVVAAEPDVGVDDQGVCGAKLSKSAVSAAVGFMGVPFGWLGFCGFGFAASLRRLPWDGFKAAFARA